MVLKGSPLTQQDVFGKGNMDGAAKRKVQTFKLSLFILPPMLLAYVSNLGFLIDGDTSWVDSMTSQYFETFWDSACLQQSQ